MKIRFATLNDIPACIELGRQMHEITRFAAFDFDAERVAQNLRAVIETGQNIHKTHCFFIAEHHDEVVGALIGCIERHFFSDRPVASVMQYVVPPQRRMGGAGLRMLTAFRQWAENRSAFELCVGTNSGVEIAKTDRFLKRLGFRQTGGNYSLSLATPTDPAKPVSQHHHHQGVIA